MSGGEAGYSEADLMQHAVAKIVTPGPGDVRSPFQHDVDRILYSSEFRALAGRTQVVASDQLGGYHNRLTHSLKVAQIGRRLAALLTANAPEGVVGPSPDLLEAAGLLHDIGHPPFGHIGETTLAKCVDELRASGDGDAASFSDGFQGNAQNLRIATYLAARSDRDHRGMGLTRATLDGATKYPWKRGLPDAPYAAEHWGVYGPEEETAKWLLGDDELQAPPATKADVVPRPVEEQIMDWADEVTYACHDVEDFHRAGVIPLDRVFAIPADNPRRAMPLTFETDQFLLHLAKKAEKKNESFDQTEVVERLREIQNIMLPIEGPYVGDFAGKWVSARSTSGLISYFVTGLELKATPGAEALTRYGATLEVPTDHKRLVQLLKELIWFYVIDRPGLAGQQLGQRRIVHDLLQWVANDPGRLLPPDRREEYLEQNDEVRAAADYVSSMTEVQALTLHRRMSGVDYGQITDLL